MNRECDRLHRGVRRAARTARGAMILESTVALVILGAAVISVSHLSVVLVAQQRSCLQRQLARQEAANLMERLHALPFADLTEDRVQSLAPSPTTQRGLASLQHAVTVEDAGGMPRGRRIVVEVRWTNPAGRPAGPIRLTAWRYSPEQQP